MTTYAFVLYCSGQIVLLFAIKVTAIIPGGGSTQYSSDEIILKFKIISAFNQFLSSYSDKLQPDIIQNLTSYFHIQDNYKSIEHVVQALDKIKASGKDGLEVLDEFVGAFPEARIYVYEGLWSKGCGNNLKACTYDLTVDQRVRLAYLKYYLISKSGAWVFNSQSLALNSLTPKNFDNIVKAGYASMNMSEGDNKHSLEANWMACEEFMHGGFNLRHPLWKFFSVLGASRRVMSLYIPPFEVAWVKKLQKEKLARLHDVRREIYRE